MTENFSRQEKKLIAGISFLMGLRMMGTSLIIPVFSIFAINLAGASDILAGIAVGVFGFSQVLFQLPMGGLSDRWGRKQVVIMGLGVFAAGTLVSGLASNIYVLIISRFIAGAGAVSGVTMAWLADGVNVKLRSTALSYVGMSIGLSMMLGFPLSSIIAGYFSIPSLFYVLFAITIISIFFTWRFLENVSDDRLRFYEELRLDRSGFRELAGNRDLLRLNITGFIGNVSLIGMFFIMPLVIHEMIEIKSMWKLYMPMALLGTALMYGFARQADISGTRKIAVLGILLELAGILLPVISHNIWTLFVSFALFYTGHCILSPVLPAAVSRYPSSAHKGSIMSMFNASQFLGSAVGGVLCGHMKAVNPLFVFITLALFQLVSLAAISGFRYFDSDS
jgi:MFS family permease